MEGWMVRFSASSTYIGWLFRDLEEIESPSRPSREQADTLPALSKQGNQATAPISVFRPSEECAAQMTRRQRRALSCV